jgi:hypothetical protein
MLVRIANGSDAGIVADSRLLHFRELNHLRIGSVELFELFYAAGPHARLIQWTVVREGVLVAPKELGK